jgi:hypothetical protein
MNTSNPFAVAAFTLLTVLSPSCKNQSGCDPTDEQKKVISSEIETIVRNFYNAGTLTWETHAALRANVQGYVMGGDGKILFTDYASYVKGTKSAFESVQRFTDFETVAIYVYVLSKDAATCTTEFKSKFLATTGDTVVNNGCWTFVFKKFGNSWKVIQENGTHLRK